MTRSWANPASSTPISTTTVIARADGSVLYNFAVAIDDLDADITHVVRGEDHVSNTPKQVLVLEAAKAVGIGAEAPLPMYAHLPLLHGPDGRKLSKRHGAASVGELREAGYLPEAVRNYLALLGWGAGDDATVLSTAELVERFTLEPGERLQPGSLRRGQAQVAERRLHTLAPGRAADQRLEAFTGREGLAEATRISQEKIHTLADFWPLSGFLFDGPEDDPAARQRWLGNEGRTALLAARTALADAPRFDETAVGEALNGRCGPGREAPRDLSAAASCHLRHDRVAGHFESVALLGREETLRRIDRALAAD